MVSVIIPNFNHSAYLKKRIESVINQSYADLEVIILDDCSSDNSREVIENFRGNSKVSHIVFNKENSGSPFIQWEKGLALAKGQFIWIAESDDYIDSLFLETVMPILQYSDVGVAFVDSNIVDSNEVIHPDYYKKYRNKIFNTCKWDSRYTISGTKEIKDNLFLECTLNNTSAVVFKKELLQHVNFTKLQLFKYCGDWYFFISILMHCNIAYLPTPMNFFKYGTNNFAAGTKSVLNYFKERFMVRYFFWQDVRVLLDRKDRVKLYKQMGTEMKIQMNEMVKGKSSTVGTLSAFLLLFRSNKALFCIQSLYMLRSYIWKR